MKTYIKKVNGSPVATYDNKYRTITDFFYLSIYENAFSKSVINDLTSDYFNFLSDSGSAL